MAVSRPWHFRLGCATTLAVVAAACQSPPCNPSLDASGRYQLDVVERYDEQSQFTYTSEIGVKPAGTSGACTHADGVGPGASLVLQGTGTFDRQTGSCRAVTAALNPPPAALTITGPATSLAVTAAMTVYGQMIATDDVTFDGCSGTLGLVVLPGAGSKADDIFLRRRRSLIRTPSCSRCSRPRTRRTRPARPATTTSSFNFRSCEATP